MVGMSETLAAPPSSKAAPLLHAVDGGTGDRTGRLARRANDEESVERVFVGDTAVVRRLFDLVRRIAAADVTVLIEGETGTGKEIVARAIHAASRRRSGPFVALNCAD